LGIEIEKYRRAKVHDSTIVAVRYSPSGSFLATADSGGKIVVWPRGLQRGVKSVCSAYSPLTGIWFSEDEQWLIAGHQQGHIVAYQVPKLQIVGHLQLSTGRKGSENVLAGTTPVLDWVILVICPANDPNFYAVLEFCDFFTIRRQDLHIVKYKHLSRNPFYYSAASADGRIFFLGDDLGYIIRSHIPEMKLELFGEHREQVAGFDMNRRPITMNATTGITGLSLSRDSKTVFSTSRSGGVQIWEAQAAIQADFSPNTSAPLAAREPIQKGWMRGICFLPVTGAVILGTDDGQVIVWEYQSGDSTFWAQCPEGIRSIDASPDGAQVAVGCEDGGIFIVPWPETNEASSSGNPSGGWFSRLFGKHGNPAGF
jgi:WD40 repeat protein